MTKTQALTIVLAESPKASNEAKRILTHILSQHKSKDQLYLELCEAASHMPRERDAEMMDLASITLIAR